MENDVMRIKAKKLRSIIAEIVSKSPIEADVRGLKWVISAMPADAIADRDYVDSSTGEVMLQSGKPARSSALHPQNAIDREARRRDQDRQYEKEQEEDNRLADEEYSTALAEYEEALAEYASDWAGFDSDHTPEDVAHDAALGFFDAYPWREWAAVLGFSKDEMLAVVIDHVYEAMSG